LLLALAIFLLAACREPAMRAESVPAPAPAPPSAEPETTELAVPGHRPAVLVVPPGAGPRPVLVAAHGAGDRAEWQCEWWAPLLGRRGFVLCPRGRPMTNAPGADTGYYYPDHYALGKEVLAALDALGSEYGERVDTDRATYAGYSQGAIMGALFAAPRGNRFARLVLIEGGYAEWNVPSATRFRRAGGERVLLACGQSYCQRGAERAILWLRRAGVEARLEHAPGAGHTYGGEIGERVASALPWLFDGDSRWAD
jgi:pimeloyl-ACP methyl ester carboxylesterase